MVCCPSLAPAKSHWHPTVQETDWNIKTSHFGIFGILRNQECLTILLLYLFVCLQQPGSHESRFSNTVAAVWTLRQVSWRILPICCCEFLRAIHGAELSFCQAVTGEQKREIITYIPPGDTRSPGDGRQYTKYRKRCRMSFHYLSLLSYD